MLGMVAELSTECEDVSYNFVYINNIISADIESAFLTVIVTILNRRVHADAISDQSHPGRQRRLD